MHLPSVIYWRDFTSSVAFVLLLRTCTISTLIFIDAFPAHSSFFVLLHANKASRSSSLISCLPDITSIGQWLPPLFYSPTVQTTKKLRNYLTEKISPMVMHYNNSRMLWQQVNFASNRPGTKDTSVCHNSTGDCRSVADIL